ncbi:coordinator of PRMT5 and differentiation stimulator isoform X2 [Lepus europaeus]|uniref:coordinator of PRMT5 and differentiation stimulator isoform X2 n=1 Tax=Lepus europaeus TaxID=9983 RepID=UPI002B4890A7|nr:coordinator of PRMT5 and differentiation stimulator isoform X2 [Lepus europaeus]
MDPQAAGARARARGAAEPPRGPPLPSTREAPRSLEAAFATAHPSGPETEAETATATDRLASGAQSVAPEVPAQGEGSHSEEEGLAGDEEESDGEPTAWEVPEGRRCWPTEHSAELCSEDWDLELQAEQGNPYDADDIQGSICQEVKPWACCAARGDMIYDPSWHHPPPLIPHYSKMVFETGQFDDAED